MASVLVQQAEIFNLMKQYPKAIEACKRALPYIHPFHCENIKVFTVLMKSYFSLGQMETVQQYYYQALKSVAFHWGNMHPLMVCLKTNNAIFFLSIN